jgi:parvulin-like peptidyl-prolyl isomerase
MINTSAMSVPPNGGGQREVLSLNVFAAASAALAGPDVGNAVDGNDAIEADANAAEQSSRRLAAAGGAPVENVVGQQNARDRLTEYAAVCASLEFNLDVGRRPGAD